MFTGIIQARGAIGQIEPIGGDVRLHIRTGTLSLDGVVLGDSIAVSGACLTVISLDSTGFAADVSNETLTCTTLGELGVEDPVNLERSLTPSSALGGHLVTGHIDGVATLVACAEDARSARYDFEVPRELSKYIAAKGSVCVDGISLTVNSVDENKFSVNVIPHTSEVTTLGGSETGKRVNIEIDLLARYVERILGDRS
ncbi:MAG: riboflavin synthase [Gammaproteobacteria bacterium]|jgi:riboflavin synthase